MENIQKTEVDTQNLPALDAADAKALADLSIAVITED